MPAPDYIREHAPPPPAAPGTVPARRRRPYRDPSTLCWLTFSAFIFCAVLQAAALPGQLLLVYALGVFDASHHDTELADIAYLLIALPTLAYLALFVPTVIAYCMWVYRVAHNARTLDAAGFKVGPGLAVGWHFIPIAALFMPYVAVSELWRASSPEFPPETPTAWRGLRTGWLLPVWWLMWAVGSVVSNIGTQIQNLALDSTRGFAAAEQIGACIAPVGQVMVTLAACLCAAVVLKLSKRQETRLRVLLAAHRTRTTPPPPPAERTTP